MRWRAPLGAPLSAGLVALVVAALGVAGLVRGALPNSSDAPSPGVVVSGAWVREPAPPTDAVAGYFTVRNTADKPDEILSIRTDAGRSAVLHTYVDGRMTAVSGGTVVPAHGRLVLSVGKNHLMIQKLLGTLRPGDTVRIDLEFMNAGDVRVTAPVIALGAPAPSASNGADE